MPITVLSDVIIPCTVLAAGVRGKNMRNNTRVTTFNGNTQVNVNWLRTQRQYELGVIPLLIEQWQQIEALHEVTEGGAYGMLMRDPKDDETTATTGKLYPRTNGSNSGTVGFGYGVPTFNFMKRYAVTGTSRFKDRKLTRVIATPLVYKNDVALVAGSGAGQFSVDYATGIITINDDASAYLVSATVGATTVITFSSGSFGALFIVGGRLWLQGVTGTAATLLNNKSHEITNISGSTITIAANTTGLTITAGLCLRYPQPADTVKWAGFFYVPVHFMDDSIDWDLARPGDYDDRLIAGPSVVLQEIFE